MFMVRGGAYTASFFIWFPNKNMDYYQIFC